MAIFLLPSKSVDKSCYLQNLWSTFPHLSNELLFSVLSEPHGRDVCVSCYNNGEYPHNTHYCIYQNRLHGCIVEPLSAFLHHLCLYKRVSSTAPDPNVSCCVVLKNSCNSYCYKMLKYVHTRARVKQRLALYHGVQPIYMQFSDDAEDTFSRALNLLMVGNSSFYLYVSLSSNHPLLTV